MNIKTIMMTASVLAGGAAYTAEAVRAVSEEPLPAAETVPSQPAEAEPADEDTTGLHAEVSLDLVSSYMWRGQICSDVPAYQPGVTLSYDFGEDYGGIYASVWSSFRMTSRRDGLTPVKGMGCQEIDYTAGYTKSFGAWDFDLSHIWYTFPREGHSTREICLSATYNNDFVTPTLATYWDYDGKGDKDEKAFYFNFGLSHDFALTDSLTFTPAASLGLGTDGYLRQYGVADGDLHRTAFLDQQIGATLAYAITDNLAVSAYLNYVWIVDRDTRRAGYMGYGEGHDKDNRLWGGVNMTFAF